MPRQVAFLRALNVGGHTLPMAELRAHLEALGFTAVETFLASGNVLFETLSRDAPALEAKIEAHLKAALGYEVATFLRSTEEVSRMLKEAPFTATEREGAGAFNVAFLKRHLDPGQEKALAELASAQDRFRVVGRELFWLCQVKQSESRFSNALLERRLGLQATFRGWNTLERLGAKYGF